MYHLNDKIDLADKLFANPEQKESVTIYYGTALTDSSNGQVTVSIGEDEDGNYVTVDVPTVASVVTGDQVAIVSNQGTAQAIGSNGWGDAIQTTVTEQGDAIETMHTTVEQTESLANATNQHFWTDENGAHVTEVDQDLTQGTAATFNSEGMLISIDGVARSAHTADGINFYDGDGDVTASFNADGAVIGEEDLAHVVVDESSVAVCGGNQRFVVLSPEYYSSGQFTGGGLITFSFQEPT